MALRTTLRNEWPSSGVPLKRKDHRMNSSYIEQLVTEKGVERAARQAVLGALGGDFSVDPIVGPAMSRCFSVIGSLIQRHGLLIQRTLADALVASGRFDVFSNVQIPLTEPQTTCSRRATHPAISPRSACKRIRARSGW